MAGELPVSFSIIHKGDDKKRLWCIFRKEKIEHEKIKNAGNQFYVLASGNCRSVLLVSRKKICKVRCFANAFLVLIAARVVKIRMVRVEEAGNKLILKSTAIEKYKKNNFFLTPK